MRYAWSAAFGSLHSQANAVKTFKVTLRDGPILQDEPTLINDPTVLVRVPSPVDQLRKEVQQWRHPHYEQSQAGHTVSR